MFVITFFKRLSSLISFSSTEWVESIYCALPEVMIKIPSDASFQVLMPWLILKIHFENHNPGYFAQLLHISQHVDYQNSSILFVAFQSRRIFYFWFFFLRCHLILKQCLLTLTLIIGAWAATTFGPCLILKWL